MTKTNKTTKAVAPVKVLTTAAELSKAINSIETRGKRLDRDIQSAAISCMVHADTYGDVTLTNRLVAAMPKGSRVNALLAFLEFHGPMRYDTDAKELKFDRNSTLKLDAAQAVMWTSFKPESAYKPLDLSAAVNALIRKCEKDMQELGNKSAVDPAMVTTLKELAHTAQPEPSF